ncbi:type I restriction and modification enzyme subunit R-like protein [Algoriphagus boseongensis]|uniref:Type I restriction and modification enzyme subunit R-like protein n=1 Tax=Algoriphagus boseongensis TaxID=1442587 RepID=A0A4R6T6V9_9BACT|nr:type I restriction enzyme HsdR N-terminal domain-containing protein [Algoriphagus boseongensis]TDQ18356.1 type I restriction and modification enzyme subunit R-like protein [Algoriphagus boseongensis]
MITSSPKDFQLPVLSLPAIEPQLKWEEDKAWIFDSLRKKYLVLTPEEWVRQHWVSFLIHHKGYPKGLFSLEKGMKYNQLAKRTDLVIFDRDARPFLLVECKAPEVKIDEKTLAQAMAYNKQLNCQNIVLSNGMRHFCFSQSKEDKSFFQIESFPEAP